MTGRQALNRAVLHLSGIDISLIGDWEPLPDAILNLHGPEIAKMCRIYPSAIQPGIAIVDLVERIGGRFINRDGHSFLFRGNE